MFCSRRGCGAACSQLKSSYEESVSEPQLKVVENGDREGEDRPGVVVPGDHLSEEEENSCSEPVVHRQRTIGDGDAKGNVEAS